MVINIFENKENWYFSASHMTAMKLTDPQKGKKKGFKHKTKDRLGGKLLSTVRE